MVNLELIKAGSKETKIEKKNLHQLHKHMCTLHTCNVQPSSMLVPITGTAKLQVAYLHA